MKKTYRIERIIDANSTPAEYAVMREGMTAAEVRKYIRSISLNDAGWYNRPPVVVCEQTGRRQITPDGIEYQ